MIAMDRGTGAPRPLRIGCHAIDAELFCYLRAAILRHWPRCRVLSTDDAAALMRWHVDLWLVDRVPTTDVAVPLLALGPPARDFELRRLAPGRWELRAPFLGLSLRRAVEQMLSSPPDPAPRARTRA